MHLLGAGSDAGFGWHRLQDGHCALALVVVVDKRRQYPDGQQDEDERRHPRAALPCSGIRVGRWCGGGAGGGGDASVYRTDDAVLPLILVQLLVRFAVQLLVQLLVRLLVQLRADGGGLFCTRGGFERVENANPIAAAGRLGDSYASNIVRGAPCVFRAKLKPDRFFQGLV